ncbi:MAG TPA: site-specific DNA-methyltransferase [Candidatus Alistipes faecavium]|nr:site-specific DNA-methyltransferase [Candidatus Alistipes faecavium]
MEHLKMQTADMADRNIEQIGALFPECLTERINSNGRVEQAIDFDKLRQLLAHDVVEGPEQRYQFTWPDKRAAIRLANTPTSKTLRPCRAESVDFDTTQNLYIEGDNLDVLKLLRENYLGKVKMIYIDPPYNTGNDFVYNDDFAQGKTDFEQRSGLFDEEGNQTIDPMQRNTEANGRFHTDWLNMIYPRLKVARDLLSDDGVIFISIDDNEIENLKKVGNEIFGESNFVGQWNWFKSATPPNLSYKIKKNIEYIIAYEKHKDNIRYSGLQKVSSSSDPFTKPQNSLKVLTFPAGSIQTNLKDGVYSKGIYGTDKFPNELLNDLIVENGINSNAVSFRNKFIWVQSTLDENLKQKLKVYLSKSLVLSYKRAEYNPECPPNLIDQNVQVSTTEQAGSDLDSLFDKISVFDYPKPVSLLTYLLRFKNDPSSIVLDFFSGSATTAHAVMQLNAEDGGNRKFIMVQLPEKTDPNSEAYKAGYPNICEIGKERIRRAGKKIKEENKDKEAIDRLDTGFRVLKLDSSNMADVYYTPAETPIEQTLGFEAFEDNIKPDRTAEDLLFQVMPECNLPLSSRIEEREIHGKKVYAVDDNYLVACFDRDIDELVITEIARMQPYYFVMRDASATTDNVLDNFDQIFNAYSKETIRRIL